MGYVDSKFYKETYHGNSIPDANLQNMLDRASRDIDILTRMRIKKFGGFNKLSSFEQIQVQLAVCSQADYLQVKSSVEGVSSYSIGDVSVSMKESTDTYDKGCISYLNATRLMCRGL